MRRQTLVLWLLAVLLMPQLQAAPTVADEASDARARGAYLARLGNCRACHTAPGDEPFAGGRPIDTPQGRFYAPNLTPDEATGLGAWSEVEFRRAMREGIGRRGEPLYPVFPYTHFAAMSDQDVSSLYVFLRSLAPVLRENRAHELQFPYSIRSLMWLWRAAYFRPREWQDDRSRDAQWNRGAYLVEAVAHCNACHRSRGALGALHAADRARGGELQAWYAPVLDASIEAGVMHWRDDQVVALLGGGQTDGASTLGPMAEIVFEGLQHATPDDLASISRYLRSLDDRSGQLLARRRGQRFRDSAYPVRSASRGRGLYESHCVDCHGESGEGRAPAAPALRANRALNMSSAVNPIRVILYGGFSPATAAHPRPFGMPPFQSLLSDQDVADILNYLRSADVNDPMAAVPPLVLGHEVRRQRRLGVLP